MKKKYYLYGIIVDTKDAIEFSTKKKCRCSNFLVDFREDTPDKEQFKTLLKDCLINLQYTNAEKTGKKT